MSKGIKMNQTPKIRYQLFMYNYYLKYIKNNLYNERYDEKYIIYIAYANPQLPPINVTTLKLSSNKTMLKLYS